MMTSSGHVKILSGVGEAKIFLGIFDVFQGLKGGDDNIFGDKRILSGDE